MLPEPPEYNKETYEEAKGNPEELLGRQPSAKTIFDSSD